MERCSQSNLETSDTHLGSLTANSEVINNRTTGCDCAQCFDHIKILTDQIFELTKNQNEMRKQLSELQTDNIRLISALNSHEEAIGDILINDASYAGKLKHRYKETLSKSGACSDVSGVNPTYINPITQNPIGRSRTRTDFSPTTSKQRTAVTEVTREHNLQPTLPQMKNCVSINPTSETQQNIRNISSPRASEEINDNEGFHLVVSRKTKNYSLKRNNTTNDIMKRRRPEQHSSITGKAIGGHNLTVTDRLKFLFISRLSIETKCEDLKSFLTERERVVNTLLKS
ncbi:hypothetical protein J6590_042280 [Homalodisca vitripennis]|nr:hypothetical protein J6590_042280 [Homalodisca vitripennis]